MDKLELVISQNRLDFRDEDISTLLSKLFVLVEEINAQFPKVNTETFYAQHTYLLV